MNLIAEIGGHDKASAGLHIITTEAHLSLSGLCDARATLFIPRVANHFDALKTFFPRIHEADSNQSPIELEKIEITFHDYAQALVYKRYMDEDPNATIQLAVNSEGQVTRAEVLFSKPEEGSFEGLAGREFALKDRAFISQCYPGVTIAAIYLHPTTEAEPVVYANRCLLHDENGEIVLDRSHMTTQPGDPEVKARLYSIALRSNENRKLPLLDIAYR
jgi:hypothetical protein